MTVCNSGMHRLLEGCNQPRDPVAVPPIRACTDGRGRVYYHAGLTTAYYGPEGPCIPGGSGAENYSDLNKLEWDLNDMYIGAEDAGIGSALGRALAIVRAWQEQMEREFPETPFDIFLFADEGSDPEEEDEIRVPAVTVHFYAVRDGRHHIQPEALSGENAQPAIFVQVNQGPQEKKENAIC